MIKCYVPNPRKQFNVFVKKASDVKMLHKGEQTSQTGKRPRSLLILNEFPDALRRL